MNAATKRLLVAGALAGVLLLGGLPALGLAAADEDTTPPPRSAGTDPPRAGKRWTPPGPPPWVHLRGSDRDAAKQRWKDERHARLEAWLDAKRRQQEAWRATPESERQGPPPWAGGPWRADR